MNKIRRIGAIVGLIFLCSLYLLTVVAAIFAGKSAFAKGLFFASAFSTIVVPIMIWIAITVYQWVHRDDPKEEEPPKPEE